MTEPNADGILDGVPTGRDTRHVALVSGGHDSTTAASVAVEVAPKIDALVYLDTGTGLDAAREYLAELADHLGIQLWTLRTHENYEDWVSDKGFPGAGMHSIAYRKLKERQLQKLATIVGNQQLVFWTGVRSQESSRRMQHVERVDELDRYMFVSPIHDWSNEDCREYIDDNDLPKADYWNALGRSVDCFCGCFASREELIDLDAAGYEEHSEWIRSLESEIVDDFGQHGRWAHSSMGTSDFGKADVEDGRQMTLCSDCKPRYPTSDEEDTDE
jgi:3'-phosphoadenosine 5'-phosphosulfate sulfotransferase (PAPS reductase)/FAD synthetase